MLERARGWLSGRAIVWRCAAISILLGAVSVFGGLQTEDMLFRAAVRTRLHEFPSRINLYDAGDVNYGVAAARFVGNLPWVTSQRFRISFWRPVSSLTHYLDYGVWPHAPGLMHFHSLLYYAALVAVVAWLLRRLLHAHPAWLAGLAALIFTVDDAHGQTVGWLANRHAILGSLCGLAALALHDRWRRDGWRAGALLSPCVLALGFACSEFTAGVLGYFLAYAWLIDPAGEDQSSRLLKRLGSLAGVTLVSAGWLTLFRYLRHGARNSAIYLDPFTDPVGLVQLLPERLAVMSLGQLAGPPADTWHYVERSGQVGLATAGALCALVVGILIWRLKPPPRLTGFFTIGGGFALLGTTTTFPSDRMLLLVGFGAAGLFALLVRCAIARGSRSARSVAGVLLLVHVALAAALYPWRTLTMQRMHNDLLRASDSAFEHVTTHHKRLIVVNAPDYYFCKMIYELRWTQGLPDKRNILCLVGSLYPATIERFQPFSLRVRPHRHFLERPFNQLYRGRNDPLKRGDNLSLGDVLVAVSEVTPNGVPREAIFSFSGTPDNKIFHFVEWKNGKLVPFEVPPVGSSVVVGGK